jgi:hypothetical protein
MRLYYFIVHEDADARQSRRVQMRLEKWWRNLDADLGESTFN